MKTAHKNEKPDELRPEYDLAAHLAQGVRGKYAGRFKQGTNLVLLSPDVAKVFTSDKAVNEALRLILQLKKIQGNGRRKPSRTHTPCA